MSTKGHPNECSKHFLPDPSRDQASETTSDECAPGIRTCAITFDLRQKACMGEADFRLLSGPADLEDDLRASPLGFIFEEIQLAIGNQPGNFFAGKEFSHLLLAVMMRH